jgi:hypothetical protein
MSSEEEEKVDFNQMPSRGGGRRQAVNMRGAKQRIKEGGVSSAVQAAINIGIEDHTEEEAEKSRNFNNQ